MLADYHVHCEYSDDSDEPIENVVKQAIALQVEEICFSDHVDYRIKYDTDDILKLSEDEKKNMRIVMNVDYPLYFDNIEKLQKKYESKLVIKKGLEFGVQTHTIPQFQKLFNSYPLDFVIMSCHQVEDKEFWTYEFQEEKEPDEYIQRYYQEIYDCVIQYKDYSVLGHLDMIQRYTKPRHSFEKSKDIITKILKQVIQDGKGIEVNTSSFQYGLPDLMPEHKILELYHSLGGNIITVGSDCHTTSRLGDHIPEIYKILKEIGFTHHCTFDKMNPVFHKL